MPRPPRSTGRRDRAARAALAPDVAAGLAVCGRCLRPIAPDEPWDAGHVEDVATGGDPRGPVRPEHTSCNRSAGAALALDLRRPSRRRPGAWTS